MDKRVMMDGGGGESRLPRYEVYIVTILQVYSTKYSLRVNIAIYLRSKYSTVIETKGDKMSSNTND